MTISFEDALQLQATLQTETYGKPLDELQGDELKEAARTHVLALLDEIHEVLGEVPWKPWKKQGTADWIKYQEEMVDAFHFFMNLMLIGGMTVDSLLQGYEWKHDENIERQKRDY